MPKLALALLLLWWPAMAQDMKGMPGNSGAPSDAAYAAAMNRMMAGMQASPTGNADADFVSGMIPHHQGAIDMARVELTYGKDATLRQLATDIIAAQTREIAFMHAWQAKHGVK